MGATQGKEMTGPHVGRKKYVHPPKILADTLPEDYAESLLEGKALAAFKEGKTADADRKCAQCNKPKPAQICAGCKEVYYCDEACQKTHWPNHGARCREIQKAHYDSIEEIYSMMYNPKHQKALLKAIKKKMTDEEKAEQEALEKAAESEEKGEGKESFHRHNVTIKSLEEVVYPKTVDDVIGAVQKAVDKKWPIKGAGSCYAFNQATNTNGVLIVMADHMKKIEKANADLLLASRSQQAKYLFEIEAGITVEMLDDYLWKQSPRLAIVNQTGWEKLNVIGTCTTGANGSGIPDDIGPMSSMLLSVHLVTVNPAGQVVELQVESSTFPITDPEKFKKAYETKRPNYRLVQDDILFNAVKVGFGSLGVIVSAIVRTIDAYWTREDRFELPLKKARARIEELLDPSRPDYKKFESWEVWLSPYKFQGDYPVVISTYTKVPEPHPTCPKCCSCFYVEGCTPKGCAKCCIVKRPSAVTDFETVKLGGDIMTLFCNTKSLQWAVPGMHRVALSATVDSDIRMPVYESRNFGASNLMSVVVSGMILPVGDKGKNVLQGVDAVHKAYELRRKAGFMSSVPFSLRFLPATNALLAPSYENSPMVAETACSATSVYSMVEQPVLKATRGAQDTMTAFRKSLTPLKGRSHWAMSNDMEEDGKLLKSNFPDSWESWIQAWHTLNCSGVFTNVFTKQVGILTLAAEVSPTSPAVVELRKKAFGDGSEVKVETKSSTTSTPAAEPAAAAPAAAPAAEPAAAAPAESTPAAAEAAPAEAAAASD